MVCVEGDGPGDMLHLIAHTVHLRVHKNLLDTGDAAAFTVSLPRQVLEVVTRVLKSLHEQSQRGEILVHTVCEYGGEALYHLGGIFHHQLYRYEDAQGELITAIRLLAPELVEKYSTEEYQ